MSSDKEDEKAKHPLHAALKTVKEANPSEEYWEGVECLEKMLLNVKNYPSEEKYRRLPIDEPWYVGKVGGLEKHELLMKAVGFQIESSGDAGYDFYVMHASPEQWKELLMVGTILHEVQRKHFKKKRSKSKEPHRSSSKKSLKSGAGSSHHSGKKSRRASNESNLEDSGAISLFDDEFGGETADSGNLEGDGEKQKTKSKKKKKKKSSEEEGEGDGEKKKSPKNEDSLKSMSLSSEEGNKSGSLGASGESFDLDEGEGEGKPKKDKKKKKTNKEVDPSFMSPIKGVTKAKYNWAMAASAVMEANRTKDTAAPVSEQGAEDKPKAIDGGGTNTEALPLVSPIVSTTAKKDYWKSAATQALLLARMKEEDKKDEVGDQDEKDGENNNDDDKKTPSPGVGKGLWKNAMAKVNALDTIGDATGGKEKSRRGLWGRSASTRSNDSSDDDASNRRNRRAGMERAGSKSRRSSRRRMNPDESSKRIQALEKGLSKNEIEEHRKMLREQEQLRAEKRERLVQKIKREHGPRWTKLLLTVSLLTAAELSLNLGQTVISFISLLGEFSCCGNSIESGTLTIGLTVPYVTLVLTELFMMVANVIQARANSAWDRERLERFDEGGPLDDLEFFDDEESWDSEDEEDLLMEKERFRFGEILKWILVANPFLGCLLSWVLLYEVNSKREAFMILSLEAGAIVLMFVTLFLERTKLTCCTLTLHALPLIPFGATCFVIWYYLEKGGVCWREQNFWFDACGLCSPEQPAPEGAARCPDGSAIFQGTYCGEVVSEQFCYYSY